MDTLRVVYRGIHSKTSGDFLSTDYVNWTVLRITWPPIHSNSIVLISASECRTDDVQRFTPFFDGMSATRQLRFATSPHRKGLSTSGSTWTGNTH